MSSVTCVRPRAGVLGEGGERLDCLCKIRIENDSHCTPKMCHASPTHGNQHRSRSERPLRQESIIVFHSHRLYISCVSECVCGAARQRAQPNKLLLSPVDTQNAHTLHEVECDNNGATTTTATTATTTRARSCLHLSLNSKRNKSKHTRSLAGCVRFSSSFSLRLHRMPPYRGHKHVCHTSSPHMCVD